MPNSIARTTYKLVLASESPRRRQLLEQAGFIFDVVPVKVSEIPDKNLNINDQILDIARRKAQSAFSSLQALYDTEKNTPFVVLSADTEVIFGGGPLGKPRDEKDAFRLLRLLSGQTHEVKTAVCLIESLQGREVSQVETTQVVFRSLTDAEILEYIQTKEPMDKAGAYGIQGRGRTFVEKYVGSFDNVVGLPVHLLQDLLERNQWTIAST